MKKEQLTVAKCMDKIKIYNKTGKVISTNFLDPAEIMDIEPIIRNVVHICFGGYENAERQIFVIGTDELQNAKEFIEILTIENSEKSKAITHRDILGSLLGIGITREVIGDIIIKENRADVFVTKEISKYIVQNLERIGREKVKVYKNTYENLLEIKANYKEIKTTVASLRLDAIISASTGTSREVSSKLIENQKVKVNYKIVENISKTIKAGGKISIRGYGRYELVDILGQTKKDRIRIVLHQKCN